MSYQDYTISEERALSQYKEVCSERKALMFCLHLFPFTVQRFLLLISVLSGALLLSTLLVYSDVDFHDPVRAVLLSSHGVCAISRLSWFCGFFRIS